MKFIKHLQENESVTSFCQVRSKQAKLKKNGEPYLRLVLGDRSGRIESKIWENIEEIQEGIQAGDFVKYQGVVQVYNGSKQLILKQIRKALPERDSESGFDVGDLIPCTEYDIEEMWQKLRSLVLGQTSRPCIVQLLSNVLDANEEQMKSYPAGVEIHHDYWGGFLEHVLSVLESALFLPTNTRIWIKIC